MKKLIATLGLLVVVALTTLGLGGSAQASGYADYTDDGTGTNGSPSSTAAAVLPATGGPETVLLIGGAALLAVGGTALVVSRRRRTDA